MNELIDGFDAESVPDGIVAERLDSAAYSLALSMDKKSLNALEAAGTGSGSVAEGTLANVSTSRTACTASNAYKEALAAKRTLSRMGVPNDGQRWMIVSPEYLEVLMQDSNFVKQGDLAQELVQEGAVGKIAGFLVFESSNLDFESTTRVASKKTTTEFIAGQAYQIDLIEIPYLHWWVFLALLENLPDSTTMAQRMQLRAMDVKGIKDKKMREHYAKLQKQVALPAKAAARPRKVESMADRVKRRHAEAQAELERRRLHGV